MTVRQCLEALRDHFQRAVAYETRDKGGMGGSLPCSSDFAYPGPHIYKRMKWWVREMDYALGAVDESQAEHFVCPGCGPHAAVDEDGCCVACGEDTSVSDCDCRKEWEKPDFGDVHNELKRRL